VVMKTNKRQSTSKNGGYCGWLFKLIGMMMVLAVCLGNNAVLRAEADADQAHYVPFDRESAVTLIEKTVTTKMVPYEIKGNGFTLTITKIQYFKMGWDQAQFALKCSFDAVYNKIGHFKESGEFAMTGAGLLAAREQKLGVRIINVTDVKLNGILGQFSKGIKIVANKSLAGKEFWSGPPPPTSEMMTKDNFALLLQVAMARQLPWTGGTEENSITLLVLHNLTLLPQPGKISASFDMEGTRRRLFLKRYSGRASVEVEVWIDLDRLAGKVRINRITELKLDKTPGLMEGIIRGLVNAKLKGNEMPFSWQ
jgi:hypothetical protein